MRKIKTKSTSKNSSEVTPIILRDNSKTRLVFYPLIVNNERQPEASVKGVFVFQRKGDNDSWEDYKTLDLSRLKRGEWIKLELKSEEILKLLLRLEELRDLYRRYGIKFGEKEFTVTDKNIESLFAALSKVEDIKKLLPIIANIDPERLANIDKLIDSTRVNNLIKKWSENTNNSDEEFWHNLFKQNSWIISQIFTQPFIIIGDEYFYGGKRGDNKGGIKGDFLYGQYFTKNVAFVEIKTPRTKLVSDALYRGNIDNEHNAVYSISTDLTGAINQILNQRKVFAQKQDSLEERDKNIYNSKCILIIGKIKDLNRGQQKSFEFFRGALSNIEIVTFDELFQRVQSLLDIFKS